MASSRVLTIHGQPLWQLRNAPSAGFTLASLLEQENGEISGVAVDAEGQPLAEQTVRVTPVFTVGNSRANQVMGISTTDTQGRFSFTGLQPSEYEVQVLLADEVVASAPVTLTESAMQVGDVKVTELAEGRVVHSFQDLAQRAEQGLTVSVLDRVGNEMTGEIVEISGSSLTLSVDGNRRELPESEVLRVTRPPHGMSRSTGAWIGAGLGFAGVIAVAAGSYNTGRCSHEADAVSPAFLIGGPVAGALITGRKDEELLFQAPAAP